MTMINEHYLNNLKRNIELETNKLNLARKNLVTEKEELKKLYESKINEKLTDNIDLETQKLNLARNDLNREKDEFKKLYESKFNEINNKTAKLNDNIAKFNESITQFENYKINMFNMIDLEYKRLRQLQSNLEAEKINFYAEKDIRHLLTREL
jgi:hypothetical protein